MVIYNSHTNNSFVCRCILFNNKINDMLNQKKKVILIITFLIILLSIASTLIIEYVYGSSTM